MRDETVVSIVARTIYQDATPEAAAERLLGHRRCSSIVTIFEEVPRHMSTRTHTHTLSLSLTLSLS
jgi:hypothetical protein